MGQKLELRWAETEADLHAIYRFRYEFFVEEQGLFKDEADHENRWLFDDYDTHGRLMIALEDGRVVGTNRINCGADGPFSEETRENHHFARFQGVVDDAKICVATRFLVEPRLRGSTLAFQLMRMMNAWAARNEMELILGMCAPHLVNGYKMMGWRPFGPITNHPTHGMRVNIAIVVGDLAHLRKLESPMLSALALRPRPSIILPRLLPLIETNRAVTNLDDMGQGLYAKQIKSLLNNQVGLLESILGDEEMALTFLSKSLMLNCDPGHGLIRKGQVSKTLYILLSGSLEVYDEKRLVATITEKGALVGEVAFFTHARRMSDVLCGPEGATVLALSAGNLKQLIESYSDTGARFLHFAVQQVCFKLRERAGSS